MNDSEIDAEAFRRVRAETLAIAEKRGITPDKIFLRINQGMNAKDTKVFFHHGETTEVKVPTWGPRYQFTNLAATLLDLKPSERHEISGADGEPIEIVLTWPENGNGKS